MAESTTPVSTPSFDEPWPCYHGLHRGGDEIFLPEGAYLTAELPSAFDGSTGRPISFRRIEGVVTHRYATPTGGDTRLVWYVVRTEEGEETVQTRDICDYSLPEPEEPEDSPTAVIAA